MGNTLGWFWGKHCEMAEQYKHVAETVKNIKTRVHPLNEDLCAKVRKMMSETEAQEVIFSGEERPNNAIKFLDFNTMLLPIFPENPKYKAGNQYERLTDMFQIAFKDYDIICLQEMFSIMFGELKEVAIEYAQKAGFIYHYEQEPSCPLPAAPYFCDSGLMILSRFPIVEKDF